MHRAIEIIPLTYEEAVAVCNFFMDTYVAGHKGEPSADTLNVAQTKSNHIMVALGFADRID